MWQAAIALVVAGVGGVIGLYVVGGRPRIVEVPVETTASREIVFNCLTEPTLLLRWITGLVESTPLTTGGVRVGGRSREVIVERGRRITMETEITAVDRPGRLDVRISSPGITVDCGYRIEAHGGKSIVHAEQRLTFSGALRLLAPLASRGMDGRLATDLDRLRKLAESLGAP